MQFHNALTFQFLYFEALLWVRKQGAQLSSTKDQSKESKQIHKLIPPSSINYLKAVAQYIFSSFLSFYY